MVSSTVGVSGLLLLAFYSFILIPYNFLNKNVFIRCENNLSLSHHKTDRTQISLCVISHNVITNELVCFLHVQLLTVVLISLSDCNHSNLVFNITTCELSHPLRCIL